MSWDNFNESGDLKAQVEADRNFTGYYPESVHAVSEACRRGSHLSYKREPSGRAKTKALESVDRLEEGLQPISAKKKRSKRWKMREFAMRLRESSGLA